MISRSLAVVLVLAVPLLIGCAPGAKVVGTWDLQLEMPDTSSSGLGTRIPPALLNAMKPKRNIEFKENGSYLVESYAGGEKETGKGKWRYLKTEKDVALLKVTMDGGKEQDVRMRFIDNNNVEMPVLPAGEEEWTDETASFKRRDF